MGMRLQAGINAGAFPRMSVQRIGEQRLQMCEIFLPLTLPRLCSGLKTLALIFCLDPL